MLRTLLGCMLKLGGTYGRLVLLIGSLLASTICRASDLVIPEACLPRAQQISIIPNVDSKELRRRLDANLAATQNYDYEKIFRAYSQTLVELNAEMENYKSPIFRYLSECRSSEENCNGKLKLTNAIVNKAFCDQQILESTFSRILDDRIRKFNKCTSSSVTVIQANYKPNGPNQSLDLDCYTVATMNGQAIYQNKSLKYVEDAKRIFELRKKQIAMEKKYEAKSLVPEGTKYILDKTMEEFSDNDSYRRAVNTLQLSQSFKKCCKLDLSLDEQKLSAQSVSGFGQKLQSEIKSGPLTFKTNDMLSDLVFQTGDRKFWQDFVRTQSPLAMDPSTKLRYFLYLRDDMSFYSDVTSFADFVKTVKGKPRTEFRYRLPTSEELTKYEVTTKKKLGYDLRKNGVAQTIDFNNPTDVIKNFLFNNTFSQSFVYGLRNAENAEREKKFDEAKVKTYYPELIRGFLPYQFAQTSQAYAIRELQKNTKWFAEKNMMSTPILFHEWVDRITCNYFYAYQTYCKAEHDDFRKKKHAELYYKIQKGEIPITYSGSNEKREYIYSDQFINNLNSQIKDINRFCWKNANPKLFQKNKSSFAPLLGQLNSKMAVFYQTPRFQEILGNTSFEDIFELKTSEYASKCFNKGYVFGNEGSYSELAYARTSDVYGSAVMGTVPVWSQHPEFDLADLAIQEAYVPSRFKIEKGDIEDVEDDIETRTKKEFRNLYYAYKYTSDSDIDAFLKESATTRIFALISYAVDHPSKEIGQYICNLIQESDASEYTKMKEREMLTQVTINIALVSSIFALPFTGVSILLFDTGMAIVASSAAVGSAWYDVSYYQYRNELTDIAVTTNNIDSGNAAIFHESYNENISQGNTTIIEDLGLLVVANGRNFMKAGKFIQDLMDKEFQFAHAVRENEIDMLVKRSSGAIKIDLNRSVTEFLYDYRKVTDAEFYLFKDALANGTGNQFIRDRWQNLVRYLPKEKVEKMTWSEFFKKADDYIGEKAPVAQKTYKVVGRGYQKVEEKIKIFASPYWLRLKPYINKYIIDHFRHDLENETRVVTFLNRAKAYKEKFGKEIYTDDEIKLFASRMKHYALDGNGNFYRTAKDQLDQVVDGILLRASAEKQDAIRAWLEPQVHSDLLTVDQWKQVLVKFSRPLKNVDDCEALLDVVRYAKKQYGFRQQLRNFWEMFNFKEIKGPAVYELRAKEIFDSVNEYFDMTQYARNKKIIAFLDATQSYSTKTGKGLEQIYEEIKNAFRQGEDILPWHDSNLEEVLARKEEIVTSIKSFEKSKNHLVDLVDNVGTTRNIKFFGDGFKYEKQYLLDGEKENAYFTKKYSKYLKKENDAGRAFKKALVKSSFYRDAREECSLPDSSATIATDHAYEKVAKMISIGTNVMGYWAAHASEPKNFEWVSRVGYDVSMSYFLAHLHSKVFTTKGGGPFYKILYDYLAANLVTSVSAVTYQTLSWTLWNTNEKYRDEFAKLINESVDPEQTIDKVFDKNPALKKKILERFEKIESKFNQVNRTGFGESSQSQNEKLKQLFINDTFFKDQDVSSQGLFNEAVAKGYIDSDDYPSDVDDDDVEDQIYQHLAQYNYDSLYENKSGQLKFPGLQPIDIGNADWLGELKSGYEGYDRMRFYFVYDIAGVALAYPKNNLTYKILCQGRSLPGNLSLYTALALHLTYLSAMDPIGYYLRAQVTGH